MTHASKARVLVVDDEASMMRALRANLGRHDFRVETAATGTEALAAYIRIRPDLVLLDLGLPDMDGLEVIRSIRQRANTPIVVLSGRDAEHDKVTALDLGADDFLRKPFGVNELLARVRVALRHAAHPPIGVAAIIRFGDLEIDLERRNVTVCGRGIHLTPTEWDLVKLFSSQADRVLTDRAILEAIWGARFHAQAHLLHVYVARLRKKLEASRSARRHIVTEPGVGYRFISDGLERDGE
jgi:two-component system KDP operon response regulator KdpE